MKYDVIPAPELSKLARTDYRGQLAQFRKERDEKVEEAKIITILAEFKQRCRVRQLHESRECVVMELEVDFDIKIPSNYKGELLPAFLLGAARKVYFALKEAQYALTIRKTAIGFDYPLCATW